MNINSPAADHAQLLPVPVKQWELIPVKQNRPSPSYENRKQLSVFTENRKQLDTAIDMHLSSEIRPLRMEIFVDPITFDNRYSNESLERVAKLYNEKSQKILKSYHLNVYA